MENNKLFEEISDDELELISGGNMQFGKKLVITQECIGCGACIGECTANAIDEKAGQYRINQDICIECGRCKDACPVGAITYC